MREIVFLNVRNDHGTRYEVDDSKPQGGSQSYTDVWRLVALAGFRSIELDELDLNNPDITAIFFPANGFTKTAFLNRKRKCHLIHWNLEREIGDSVNYVDEVWVSDRHYAFLADHHKVHFVPLGGHEGLGGELEDVKEFDFISLSYDHGVRGQYMNLTRSAGFKIAPNSFDLEQRAWLLKRSHFGLSLHQTPVPIIEPPRYVLFACWNIPIVAETVVDPFPYVTIPWDPQCKALMAMPPETIKKVVEHNYSMMTGKYSFKNCVERGVRKAQNMKDAIDSLKRGSNG